MYTKTILTILFSLLTIITTACTSVPRASQEQDANAKTFSIEKGKSNIYIYRNETENFNTTMSVDIDGNHVGDTEQRTFILKTVVPRKYVITAHAESTSEIELITEADKNHFVWLEVYVGAFIPRAKLHNVNSEKGQAGVNESKLVK